VRIRVHRKARQIAVSWILCLCFWPSAEAASLPLAGKVIVLDPGHAVKNANGNIINPGARARRGAFERDVALAVAQKAQELLEARGAKVFLTRTPKNPWRYNDVRQGDNRARAIFANVLHADAYVRLHCDWNRDRHFKGHTTYYFNWESRPLAEHMNQALTAALPGHEDHGIHRRSFVSVTAKMPTVLLELGVLSYKPEATLLGDPVFQGLLAQSVADGLTDYFK
jgi:N-acetylmuramoyl-L-alanine amidase